MNSQYRLLDQPNAAPSNCGPHYPSPLPPAHHSMNQNEMMISHSDNSSVASKGLTALSTQMNPDEFGIIHLKNLLIIFKFFFFRYGW